MCDKLKMFLNAIRPGLGRLVGALLGVAVAILFMTLGFWRTLLLLVLGTAGYVLGLYFDNKEKWKAGYAKLRILVIHLIKKGD